VIGVDGSDFNLGSVSIVMKLELLQHSGSFKTRGAFTSLLMRPIPPVGVVAASGGNHGVAVAFAAMRLGKPAKIFVPTVASPEKIERIRSCGAGLVVTGDRYADALVASEEWIRQSGALPVHAYDQVETLLGQGTVGLEFEEPETAPTLTKALQAGHPVDAEASGIAADSLAPKRVGELMFPIAQRYVNRVILVPDAAIHQAQQALWRTLRVVTEPGGAAAFAALLSGRYQSKTGERVGVLLCGANTTARRFRHVLIGSGQSIAAVSHVRGHYQSCRRCIRSSSNFSMVMACNIA
jgi:threonine dehydratase